MMLPEASSNQYTSQQSVTGTTAGAVAKLWRQMSDEFDSSWEAIGPQIVNVVDAGRRAAVAVAVPYTAAVLRETGQVDDAAGALNSSAFLTAAPDGRSIESLYGQAVVK